MLGQGASGALPLQTHTHTNKHSRGDNAKWEEGGPIAQGENAAPEIHNNKNTKPRRGLSSSPPPPLHAHSSTHSNTHTTAHAAPALHMLCTGGRGEEGRHTHAPPAPPHTPHVGFLEKPTTGSSDLYTGVERTGVKHQQVPGVWSRGYRVGV